MVVQLDQKRIKDLSRGEAARIAGYEEGNPAYRAKLLAMGLTRGTEVRLIKTAPFGDPVEIEVRGYRLSLRKAEANTLILESLG